MLKKFKAYARSLFYEKKSFSTKTVEIKGQAYQFKELNPNDVKDLLAVERAVYDGGCLGQKVLFIRNEIAFLNLYLGVFQGNELIGFIGARIFGFDCHITNIAVIPTYQQKNLGTETD